MAKSKKKTTKKNSVKRKPTVRKTTVKKVEKTSTPKEEPTSKIVKDFCVLVIVLLLVFGIIYVLTMGAKKIGWFDTRYNKTSPEEAEISYDFIEAGTMFNRIEDKYYVVLGDFSSENSHVSALISNYKSKDGALTVYKVNTSEGLNSYLNGEEAKTSSSDVNELSINDFTLIEVENHVNKASYVGIESIAEILK